MSDIKQLLATTPDIANLLESIGQNTVQLVTGLSGSARTLVISTVLEQKKKPIVIVAHNLFHASQLIEDFSGFVPEDQLHLFPVDEMIQAEMSVSSPEYRAERVATLDFLLSGKKGIIIIPLSGVRKLLPPKEIWKTARFKMKQGGELDPTHLAEQLVNMGYTREHLVGKPGEFSIRGGIVDIYPLTEEHPIRVDLFDTEIDSLRYFEADTQRSIENIDKITILPATDVLFTKELLQKGATAFSEAVERNHDLIMDASEKEIFHQQLSPIVDAFDKGEPTDKLVMYTDFVYPKHTTVLEYIHKNSLIIMDEYPRILETERRLVEEEAEWMTNKLAERKILRDQVFSNELRSVMKNQEQDILYFSLFQKGMGNLRFAQIHPFQYRSMQQFFGQMPLLKTEMERWTKQKNTIIVMVPDNERAKKVHQTFKDFEIVSKVVKPKKLETGLVQITTGEIHNGFELPKEKIVVLNEREMFNKVTKKTARRQTLSNAERLKSYTELNPGDFVVHVNHGIGKYTGMETLEINGIHQDYMSVIYKDDAKLFIPVTQINLLQKYVSSEAKTPKINKLGGAEWAKTKKKVAAKIEDIADDLIELYAARESEVGYAFSPDDGYQVEFENAFPYSETDDQLRSAAEIKHDMEKKKPMDRLLVGDVGYGKTEVAMRAIFKAVQDGKQAAFLVPTTILAQQHYESLITRFEDFPIEIGLLSRFRTKKQQTETIAGIKTGKVDVVIGTHRILSKDIDFHDLGLLVVDEEQRFGVKHKEKLKQLKSQVDVLTLTATPIPRTLHMSMLGVRDLSVIETPPANRYPVQTYVMEQNPGAIREAIERELTRGGQVFYLYNRVETIEKKVDELQMLVPDAKIAYAHGQMTEGQLESILYQFVEGEYDVLVTTTIIETGVDIPNVNTLFVENADHMGLSQLYQLRGRVGRSNRVAYAYFMYQANKVLNEVSEKRLQAIKDFTELGSGFKIAMRDLSIRGAGNLLGAQQHGFIDSVGFDLYSEMLSEAVMRKRGEEVKEEKTQVEIDLAINAYLPSTYIEDERQKIEIYKRIRELKDLEEYTMLQDDLIDRFGEYPDEVADLLSIGLMKMHSEKALIEFIKRTNNQIDVTLSQSGTEKLPAEEVFKALGDIPLRANVAVKKEKLVVTFQLNNEPTYQWLDYLQKFAANVAAYFVEKSEASEK
ncbi:transcription-repair coupling factor [Carnobacterium divergens]|uniref:transcription-repair coupling factor n=1 Tax=Carnobacterium divergens TaxID=2748 RepID=UPI0010720F93|nr:transcription-repair coupling factor [Carnobacterium divergens]TFJ46124.1 transcription-repair coupling factor [Carnobacterium divergens]TFJ52462.1 transcription-repair coupling factor [Carnobacterium divergens]